MESITPIFIDQLRGNPTKKCYRTAKIFLDYYSDLTYLHPQKGLSSEEMLEAKKWFESYVQTYKVRVKHHHAENGRFADNAFQQAVTK